MSETYVPPPHPPRPLVVPIPTYEEARQIAEEMNPNIRTRRFQEFVDGLPRINEAKLTEMGERDSSCPICLNTFLAVIAEEEMATAMDSVVYPVEELGVTKLNQAWQCGHMFCRRDIITWAREGRRACPMCRRALGEPIPGQPAEANEALFGTGTGTGTYGTPIEISPELIIFARHVANLDISALQTDPNDPNPPPWEEARRRFLESNPGIPASVLDGLTTGERIEGGASPMVFEEYPPPGPFQDHFDGPPEGMYN